MALTKKPVAKAKAKPEPVEEVDPIFGVLDDYEPEAVKDDFEVIKGKYVTQVVTAKVVDYEGQNEELEGSIFMKLDLVIADNQKFAGRHLFKSFNLSAPASQYKAKDGSIKTGKSGAQKAADAMFTLGVEGRLSSKEKFVEACEGLLDQYILVRAGVTYRTEDGGFSGKATEGADAIQTVKILGLAEEPAEGEAEAEGSSEF